MISLKGVSCRAITVALRYASINRYPNNIKDWTENHSLKIQVVAQEYDNRQSRSICR